MVSGGLAVTALAGCGGSDGGTEQSAQTEVSEGIKTAAEDNKVTTFALPDGPEESEDLCGADRRSARMILSGEWMRPRYFHWRTAA